MQGQLEKKKEENVLPEAKKKQVPVVHAIITTEGPMKLKDESRKIEDSGRSSFEHSVRMELDAIKKRLLGKRKKKGEEGRKKPGYGWKLSGGSEPPEDDSDNDSDNEGGDSEDEDEDKKED